MSPLDRRGSAEFRYERPLNRILLCLDDIDDVLAHIRMTSGTAILTAGEGIAEDGPEDLKSATKKEMKDVRIHARSSSFVARLSLGGSFVGTKSNRKADRKLVDEIYSLLSKRQRAFVAPLRYWIAISILILTFAIYIPIFVGIWTNPTEVAWQVVSNFTWLAFGSVSIALNTYKLYTHGCVIVIRQWRKERMALGADILKEIWKPAIAAMLAASATAALFLVRYVEQLWTATFVR